MEYAVVGGGIHGTHVASELLKDENGLDIQDVAVFDECITPLGAFEEYTRGTAMEYMRSHSGHHIGSEPYDLVEFARENGREDEFIPARHRPSAGPDPEYITLPDSNEDMELSDYRPSLDLFLDHSRAVAEDAGVTDTFYPAPVETITREGDTLQVQTADKAFDTEYVVLAVGVGETRWPDWAEDIRDEHADAPIYHAFDPDFRIEDVYSFDGNTYIIGGSITAGQIAGHIGEIEYDHGMGRMKQVHDWLYDYEPENAVMLSRHELEEELLESSPEWTDWDYVQGNLHDDIPNTPATAEDRLTYALDERFDSTIPPLTMDRVETAQERGTLRVDIDEVIDARYNPRNPLEDIELELESGDTRFATEVILATGFEPQDETFFATISDELDLATGPDQLPLLDDDTLQWRYADGGIAPIHVTGSQAILSVGPFAGNIAGARLAAQQITDTY